MAWIYFAVGLFVKVPRPLRTVCRQADHCRSAVQILKPPSASVSLAGVRVSSVSIYVSVLKSIRFAYFFGCWWWSVFDRSDFFVVSGSHIDELLKHRWFCFYF